MSVVNYKGLNEDKLMKIVYGDRLEEQFVQTSPLFGTIKRVTAPFGKQKEISFRGSAGAGIGASGVDGNLPESSQNDQLKAILTTKRLYGTVVFDREAIIASRKSPEAFVSLFKEYNETLVTAFNLSMERQMIRNDIAGDGVLYSATATPVTGDGLSVATAYVIELDTIDPLFSLENGHLINMGSETTNLKVVEVDDVAKTVKVTGTSAILAASVAGPAAIPVGVSRNLYMQGSKGLELSGLVGVLKATSGTYKSQTITRRWKAEQKDASAAAISSALLNEVITNMITGTGVKPKMILMSPLQFRLWTDQLENQKVYNLPASNSPMKNQVSYEGIEFMSTMGRIPVMSNRFVPSDTAMVLNTDHIELHCRENPKWIDDDGRVLRNIVGKDQFQSYYGVYCDFFINPFFQGILYNLKLTA